MANDPDPLSHDELTEVLAEATGTAPEEIERGAEAIDIEPPERPVSGEELEEMDERIADHFDGVRARLDERLDGGESD